MYMSSLEVAFHMIKLEVDGCERFSELGVILGILWGLYWGL